VESKGLLASLVNLELQVSPAYRVALVRMETLGKQAKLVHLDNRGYPVTRERVVTLALLVMLDK